MKSFFFLCMSFMFSVVFAQNKLMDSLENYMDVQAKVNNFSGTVLITKNHSVLLKKAYGFADYEWKIKNTIDTKFSLASVSKQFTAVAILQLAEQNKLSLKDKLSKYYPDFPKGDLISIKMLLTHNSGIGNDVEDLFSTNSSLGIEEVVKHIATKAFLFEPGEGTAYSNTGYYLLATLIEKASGQPFGQYMSENLFKRANMRNSGISSNDSIVSKMGKAYYEKDGQLIKNPYSNWKYNIGLDGVYSTVEDLRSWNKHLFDSTTLLSEQSKSQMFKTYNEEGFGYGVLVDPFYNHGHSLVGHDGGYYGTQTSLNQFTDDQVFIAILSNNGSPSYLLAFGLSAMIFGKEVELPYHHKKVEIDPALYDKYVGDYEGIKIHQKDGKLFYS
ncbi:MAG: serine hydrolase domain-containing protein, partial [Bacteroidota bacterium]